MPSSWDLIKAIFGGLFTSITTFWYLYTLIGVIIVGKIVYRLYEKQKLSKSGISEIDSMGGKTFEKYLEALFEKLGYRVERTQYIGDYGADLVTTKDEVKTIIQAKRFKGKVGIKAVQEAVAAKGYYSCSKAMVVTNSFYTKPAIELAKANDVQLWDRNDLVKALLSVKKDVPAPIQAYTEVTATKAITPPPPEQDVCFTCGKKVTDKVKQYCLANQQRFGGRIYCYEHQKEINK